MSEAKTTKINKKVILIGILVVILVVAVVIVYTSVIAPAMKKNNFIKEYGQELYDTIGLVSEGEYIKFGSYEQDNDTANGKETIEWLVLEVKDGKALVISKNILECMPFYNEKEFTDWGTCTLRTWLNEEFYNEAFSDAEKAMVPTVTVVAERSPYPSNTANPGENTEDKVFILNVQEAESYLSSNKARKSLCTEYTKAKGNFVDDNGYGWWWLRTNGRDKKLATYVYEHGKVAYLGNWVNATETGVRPVIWIDLNA
ncbi:MAG: hypothetical protein IJC94_07365 [Oscillospiraceae bacterium]|nr:hypothetical protein [Oscillospiraceae bacterium]